MEVMVQGTRLRRLSVLAASILFFSPGFSRDLSFEDRVRAQEAIERVYYSHQVGAKVSFETAVTLSGRVCESAGSFCAVTVTGGTTSRTGSGCCCA